MPTPVGLYLAVHVVVPLVSPSSSQLKDLEGLDSQTLTRPPGFSTEGLILGSIQKLGQVGFS